MAEPMSRLLELDADLASAIESPVRRGEAQEAIVARVLELAPGEMLDVEAIASAAPLGALALGGFVLRELVTSGRVSADLLGPEDVLRPVEIANDLSPLPYSVHWTAVTHTWLALLDEGFLARAAQWPEVATTLMERAGRAGRRLVTGRAIATLPSVDMRLLASLWEWAAHWGTVRGDGVLLGLSLSHERIGHLVGARRPTVTAALGRLRREGLIEARQDGVLLISRAQAHAQAPRTVVEETVKAPVFSEEVGLPRLRSRRHRKQDEPHPLGEQAELRLPGGVPAPSREQTAVALRQRLEQERATLRLASARHEQMLRRLQREASQLRANSAALIRFADGRMSGGARGEGRSDGGAALEQDEQSAPS